MCKQTVAYSLKGILLRNTKKSTYTSNNLDKKPRPKDYILCYPIYITLLAKCNVLKMTNVSRRKQISVCQKTVMA